VLAAVFMLFAAPDKAAEVSRAQPTGSRIQENYEGTTGAKVRR
jgi:hypothetical protein